MKKGVIMKNPIAVVTMKSGGVIKFELFPQNAPKAVSSLICLAKKGILNNRNIQRIVPGFVIQPVFMEEGEPMDYRFLIDGEFSANGYKNGAVMEKYSVGMAGDGKQLASGSQYFFTMTEESAAKLNGRFTVVGKVIEGFEELERIQSVPLKPFEGGDGSITANEAVTPEIITDFTVETFGQEYSMPEIIKYI